MQVFSTNQPDKKPSEKPELLARFARRNLSSSVVDMNDRYIAFLTVEEVSQHRKALQFPEYAIRECINDAIQIPKIEMLDELIYGVLNSISDNDTGLHTQEITFFLVPAGIVIVSQPCALIDDVKESLLSERLAKHVPHILPERVLFILIEKIIAQDVALMRGIDEAETILEEKLLEGVKLDYPAIIFRMRQKTLDLMQYMGLMVDLSDILEENDNNVIQPDALRMFHLIGTRLDRLERASITLRESVMQLRDAYQQQTDIDANLMMRLFTVVSTIFLPLMVLTSWYGMNFKLMPEISWKYGYLLLILAAVLVTAGTIWFCKRKKYL